MKRIVSFLTANFDNSTCSDVQEVKAISSPFPLKLLRS